MDKITTVTSCTVVIPCYNEAGRFLLNTFRDYMPSHRDISFVFVNDGSTDATLPMLENLRTEFPEVVTVIDKKENGGKGEAVRDGMLCALNGKAQFVGFWDADLATPLAAIHDLLQPLLANPEVQMVFGSRVKLMGREVERKAIRHYLGRIFATTVSILLRLPIYDTQCGAKLFRSTPEILKLFSAPFSSRWVFDVELLARFIYGREGRIDSVRQAIYEFPLYVWRDIGGSKVRPRDFFRAFLDVARIGRRYRWSK